MTDEATLDDIAAWSAFDAALALPEVYTGPDAWTRIEIAERKGISRDEAEKWAERRVAAGVMEKVKKYARNGHIVDAYKLVESQDG